MAYTTINKHTAHFNTVLYSGNGSTQSITGVGFQPDLVWVKERTATSEHQVVDAVRGYNKRLQTNSSGSQDVDSSPYNDFKSFDSDGFSIGNGGAVNENSQTYASWNWKANGAGSANTDGTINTTKTSANTTNGFSMITYSGTGSGGGTIGHGLGAKPKVFICRHLNADGNNWQVWVDTTGNGTSDQRLLLNGTGSNYNNNHITFGTDTITLPSSSGDAWSGSGKNYVGYAFIEKVGYSKFGTYIGNGNADGAFAYCGFKPSLILIKNTNDGNTNWQIYDNKRDGFNPQNDLFRANLNSAEDAVDPIDIVSNGFKNKHNATSQNSNTDVHFFMAWGQSLVGSNNIPCTAR